MLDLPVLSPALPLAALKPTTTGPDAVVGPAAAPSPAAAPGVAAAPVAGAPATTLTAAPTGTETASTGTTATTQPPAADTTKASPYAGAFQALLIVGMVAMVYLVMFRPQKKAEKERKNLLSAMKKGDRVMTIGGLVARVVSMDDDEVVLKIDESANVKATYKKSSIQQILDRDEKSK